MKSFNLGLIFLMFSSLLFSQYSETIISGRPSISSPSSTVGKGIFQIQSGVDYYSENSTVSGAPYEQNGQVFNTLLRFGFTEHFELAAGFNLRQDQFKLGGFSSNKKGVNGLTLHLRNNIVSEEGNRPSMGLQFNLNLPYATSTYSGNNLSSKIAFHLDKTIKSNNLLTFNTGLEWNENVVPVGFYILSLGHNFSSKFGAFVEYYTFIQGGVFDHKFDGGFAYLLNQNFQLDLSGGYDKNKSGLEALFVSTGISWRINKRSSK
jgi:hypothetical protein